MLDLVWRALVLCLLGGLIGVAINLARPDGLAVATYAPPATCSAGEASFGVGPEVALASQAEATALCAQADTVLADVRSAEAFAAGHVAGAIHLPCSASDEAASAAQASLSGKHLLLVYGDATADAFPVAEQMRRRLSRSDLTIRVLEGGFSAWSAAGLACTSGECPSCGAPAAHDHTGHTQ